jgi:hypothetical protein
MRKIYRSCIISVRSSKINRARVGRDERPSQKLSTSHRCRYFEQAGSNRKPMVDMFDFVAYKHFLDIFGVTVQLTGRPLLRGILAVGLPEMESNGHILCRISVSHDMSMQTNPF